MSPHGAILSCHAILPSNVYQMSSATSTAPVMASSHCQNPSQYVFLDTVMFFHLLCLFCFIFDHHSFISQSRFRLHFPIAPSVLADCLYLLHRYFARRTPRRVGVRLISTSRHVSVALRARTSNFFLAKSRICVDLHPSCALWCRQLH